jgi:hypothetical protein
MNSTVMTAPFPCSPVSHETLLDLLSSIVITTPTKATATATATVIRRRTQAVWVSSTDLTTTIRLGRVSHVSSHARVNAVIQSGREAGKVGTVGRGEW